MVAPTSSRYLSTVTLRSIPRTFHNATKVSLFNGLRTTPRFYSVLTESPEAKVYKYADVKDVAVHPENHPDSVLVDVREPTEFGDGHIPGALNIPFKVVPAHWICQKKISKNILDSLNQVLIKIDFLLSWRC